jgi:DNA-binding MarR family transcriptional regulator
VSPDDQNDGPDVWLDPQQSPGYLVRDTHLAVGRALRRRLQDYGMTTGQYYFMRALWIEEGLSQRELSQRVGTTEPTTASALRLLERKGLVRRVRNRKDRRTINLSPTPKGRNLKNELLTMAIRINDVATEGLTPDDLAAIKRLMQAMKANLDRDEAETGSG